MRAFRPQLAELRTPFCGQGGGDNYSAAKVGGLRNTANDFLTRAAAAPSEGRDSRPRRSLGRKLLAQIRTEIGVRSL